jgi:molybdate transport system substrate-binding protein
MVSGAFQHTLEKVAPEYERESGVHLAIVRGPSMGDSPTAIPHRLAQREPADVVIVARDALDGMVSAGEVRKGSEVDLVLSKIAVAVKEGTPAPDISTPAALRDALLSAQSVAYSDSASGVYVSGELFAKLGIASEMAGKARKIQATPVGLVVARGEAEVGFQQLSELKPIAGIRIVGLVPASLQKVTRFSAGIVSYSHAAGEGRNLIAFLDSNAAREAIDESGLEQAARKK